MRRAAILIPVLLGLGGMLGGSLAGCAPATPRSRAEQAALAACRRQADQAYMRQNRAVLSERDTRDSPFSSLGDSGIVSAGLGERYGRDQMIDDCLHATLAGQPPDAMTPGRSP